MADLGVSCVYTTRGILSVADGLTHDDATSDLHKHTPTLIMGSGRRDALGRFAQWLRNAKHDDLAMGHGDVMKFLFSEPELFLFEQSHGALCEQPAGRRAKSRGACSSHRHAAGTVACRRRRALAAPKDVSRRIVTSLTKSCFPGRRRC